MPAGIPTEWESKRRRTLSRPKINLSVEMYGCHEIAVISIPSKICAGNDFENIVTQETFGTTTRRVFVQDFKTLTDIYGASLVKAAKKNKTIDTLKTHREIQIAPLVSRKIRFISDVVDYWYEAKITSIKSITNGSYAHKSIMNLPAHNFVSSHDDGVLSGEVKSFIIEVRIMDSDNIIKHGFQGVHGETLASFFRKINNHMDKQ